ncbi:MAG: ArnT family glycosyltransferase [Bacteroidia bacterium]
MKPEKTKAKTGSTAIHHDQNSITEPGFLNAVERFLDRNSKLLLGLALAFCAIFGAMLFDGRLSFATDDATYINNAYNLIHHGSYPTFQGALYPFTLALLMSIFGMKLLVFKLFSLFFLLIQIWVLYKALKNRVPNLVLFAGLFTVSFNAYILTYGSSTFTEAFYMMIQAICLWAFFKLTDELAENKPFSANLKWWLLYGFTFFLLSISKNISLFVPGIVMLYFLLRKEWKYAGLAIAFFLLFKVPYELTARAIFGNTSSAQTEMLLRKDFNDPSQGNVDAGDLADRFFENWGQYISTHTFKMLNMRSGGESSLWTLDKMKELQTPLEASPFLSIIFIAFFATALYYSYKYNRYIFFLVLYVSGICFLTFIGIHTHWNQDRYMVIFLPFIVGIFVYAMYAFSKSEKGKFFQPITVIVAAILILIQMGPTLKEAPKHTKYARKYMKGDEFYGYPQGIQNYAKACRWFGENVPADSGKILANRPVEGLVFGKAGRFVRVPKPLPTNADSALAFLKKSEIHYLMIDESNLGQIRGVAQVLVQKYPQVINPQPIHTEGSIEPTAIYKLNY